MPRTIRPVTDCQQEGYGASHRIGMGRFGPRPTPVLHGWRAVDGRKWGETGTSQPGLCARFFWIAKEYFGSQPKTRWFSSRQAPRGFKQRVFESARCHKSHKRQMENYGWLRRPDPSRPFLYRMSGSLRTKQRVGEDPSKFFFIM